MAAAVNVLPDIMIIIGLALLGYGLFLFAPWVSFSVVGGIMLSIGLFASVKSGAPTGER